MAMASGMIDQVASTASEPSICSAWGWTERRYLMANTVIVRNIPTLKKTVIAIRKK